MWIKLCITAKSRGFYTQCICGKTKGNVDKLGKTRGIVAVNVGIRGNFMQFDKSIKMKEE